MPADISPADLRLPHARISGRTTPASSLRSALPTEAATTAYVTDMEGGAVSVIDTVTNVVAATIPVGNFPEGVAVAPDGGTVYVTNTVDGTLSVIDAATNTVTATILVGNYPYGVAITPDGGRVYVSNGSDGTVSVIDTATDTVTATIPVGSTPSGVAVTPDGGRVYVADNGDGTVSVIDTAADTVSATISVGSAPYQVAVTPDGAGVYVTDVADFTVSLIDTAANAVTATIPLGDYSYPYGVAVTPDGSRVYVADIGIDAVSVIDTAANTVSTTIPVGSGPYGVAVAPDGGSVYVTNSGANTVSVIDAATDTVTLTIPGVGPYPSAIAIGASATSSAVTVIAEPNPAQVHRLVTLTATVTCSEGTPAGAVEFRDGATVLGSARLRNGTATLVRQFEAGAHTITAVYGGGDGCPAAESSPITLTVNKGASTTVASALPRVTLRNRQVTLLARVLCGGILPTGTVEFFDGTTSLGTIPLTTGFARLVTSFTTAGAHSITAVHSGDQHCEPSTSPPVTVTVR